MEIGGIQAKSSVVSHTAAEKSNESGKTRKSGNDTVESTGQVKNGSINASELNLGGGQDSTLKKLLAQKAAIKKQLDQFGKDSKVDELLDEHSKKHDSLQQEAVSNFGQASRLEELKEGLKDTFGVEEGSEEQKNLELLEKQAKGTEPLSEEEQKQLADMGPLTDYQKEALKYDSMIQTWQERAEKARDDSFNENKAIEGIKLGLVKTHPMVDAKKAAEDLMKKVDEEIQKSIAEEIKKKVNENFDIDPNDQILNNPQALVEKKKVTSEDLKGLAVDEQV